MTQQILSSEEKQKAKDILAFYIKQHCWKQIKEHDMMFGKGPGSRYVWQMYMANALYNVEIMQLITFLFLQEVHEQIGHYNFQLTGREWSASPLLASIPMAAKLLLGENINAFMVKRERKSYGLHNFVEGIPIPDLPVLIVDDVLNSTNSFVHCRKVCGQEHNLKLLPFIFAPLNKYSKGDKKKSSDYDHYLGNQFKAISCVNLDDVFNSVELK